MGQPVIVGLGYFGCVFAAGFALGALRMAFIVPLLGKTVAVAMELPIILVIAWFACRSLVNHFVVPSRLVSRAVMGTVAFALLMVGEGFLSLLLAGRSSIEHLQLYREAPHMLGLAGQVAFAFFPILQIWTARDSTSQRLLAGRRKEWVGLLAVIVLYAAWTLATWIFEGRIQTLLRPDAAGDRAIYAFVANLLIGLVIAMLILRHLIRQRILTKRDAGFGPATPSPIRLAIAATFGFGLYMLQGAPSLHPFVLINAFAQVLVVSTAEVIVCWVLVGTTFEVSLRAWGRAVSLIGAALVASVLFGLYHFAHSAPFNTIGMVALLTVIGLVTSAFFFLSRDVYATILFHNCLGMLGVVQAFGASDQLNAFETLQPVLLATAFVTIGILAVSDWTVLRRGAEHGRSMR